MLWIESTLQTVPMLFKRALVAGLLLACLPLVALCGPPQADEPDARGVFVRLVTEDVATFVPWTGEASVQSQLGRLREAGGGELVFAPGDYELETGFLIARSRDLRISGSGSGATRLHFAPEPEVRPTLLADVEKGARTIRLANTGSMRAGRAYQLYKSDLKGDRILEFRVDRIEGETVTLRAPAHFMGHVKEIPAGSVVIDEINAFVLKECERVTIESLEIDGGDRGDVHGHTTYCGIYAVGVYKPRVLPTSARLVVRDCHIHGLKGRGVCVYAMKDVLVEGNHIHGIDSQAVEIDHFAQGEIRANTIEDAGVGVALNDAYSCRVQMNTVRDCDIGIGFVKHFDEAEFNVDNLVHANLIVGGSRGVDVRKGITGNRIAGNRFAGLAKDRWVLQEGGNEAGDNDAVRAR